jgi:Ca-activated chloride channel family protein
VTGSKSQPSARQNQSEEDEKTDGRNLTRETPEPEPSKAEQSEQQVLSPSSVEGQPGEALEHSEAASAVATEKTLDMQKSEQALQQWLRRIPDDPGGLLRRKFLLEHQRRVESGRSVSPQERRW